MAEQRGRVGYIETIRGLACVLLVSYHVIGSGSAYGLRLDDEHYFRVFNALLRDSRMPLFSFISGFVFNSVVLSFYQWREKVTSKARRLLLPMAFVGTIHFAFQAATVGVSQPFWTIFILPYEHFWFLQATFLLMLGHLTLSFVFKSHVTSAIVLLCVLSAAYIALEPWRPNIFSASNALYLAPYFFSGNLVAVGFTKGIELNRSQRFIAAAMSGVLLTFLLFLSYQEMIGDFTLNGVEERGFRVIIGLASCTFLMLLRPNISVLTKLGSYSFAIYLFHVIFAAGTRVVITKLFPSTDPAILYVLGMTAGICGPIMLSWIILKSDIASLFLLGINRRKRRAARGKEPNLTTV